MKKDDALRVKERTAACCLCKGEWWGACLSQLSSTGSLFRDLPAVVREGDGTMGGRGRSSKAADARESAAWELGNVEEGSSGAGHAACDASLR